MERGWELEHGQQETPDELPPAKMTDQVRYRVIARILFGGVLIIPSCGRIVVVCIVVISIVLLHIGIICGITIIIIIRFLFLVITGIVIIVVIIIVGTISPSPGPLFRIITVHGVFESLRRWLLLLENPPNGRIEEAGPKGRNLLVQKHFRTLFRHFEPISINTTALNTINSLLSAVKF